MPERPSEYARDENDWYCEPSSTVLALYYKMVGRGMLPSGSFHDPCCGGGNIVDTLASVGLLTTGSDLVDRANGRFPVVDFLQDDSQRENIICNPPFKLAVEFVEHGLRVVPPHGMVAIVAQAKFLYSQGRFPLFHRLDMDCVIHMSRRPSMPPGKLLAEKGESCRGGGSMDYCWAVWRRGRNVAPPVVMWSL